MSISISNRMSGFRKWPKADPPMTTDPARAGATAAEVIAATVGSGGKTPDQQPHRPWLVPGIGKL